MAENSEKGLDRKYRNKPLYYFELDDDVSILQWIRAQHYFDRQDLSDMYDRFNDNLACFLGKGRSMKSLIQLTDSGYNRIGGAPSTYTRLKVNRIKNIIETLVGRYLSNKTNFFVTPRHIDDFSQEAKAKTGKRVIDSIILERDFDHRKRTLLQHALIFGEAYILTFWNPDIGSPKGRKKIPLYDDNEDSASKVEVISRLGDVDFEILDPRNVTVQHANSYETAEWLIYVDYLLPETLKLDHPEYADKIKASENSEIHFSLNSMESCSYSGLVRRYRMWHRATKHMPDGRYIIATDECILLNEPFKERQLIENQLFPVAQLADFSIFGSSRGRAMSVMEPGRPLQLAIHNLWSMYIRNITKFPPMRIWPAEIDKKILEKGSANDIFLSARTSTSPQLLYSDPVSPSLMNAINLLDTKLLQLSSITPALQGQGGQNMEVRSGTMLQIFREVDAANMLPMNDRLKEVLEDVGHTILSIAASRYKDSDERLLKLFGKRSKFLKHSFKVSDIHVPMDVSILRGSAFPQSQEGKIAQIESILSMFPEQPGQKPLLSREEILDILELGEPEKIYDSITSSIDTAEKEIGDILEGRDVSAPTPQLELYSYYETYLKAMQHPQIKDHVPNKEKFVEDMAAGGVSSEAGFRLLRQVNEIETILWEKGQDNPLVGETLKVRFPFFPTIYSPEPEVLVDPREVEAEAPIPTNIIQATANQQQGPVTQ